MDEERKPVEQKPVKSLREHSQASDRVRRGIVQRVVRSLIPKDKQAAVHPPKVSSTCKILLYRDEAVVREMRDQVTAAALRDESILRKLRRIVLGQPLLSGDFTFDGLTGVDEFVLKPAAKWTLWAEVGAEFELKWNLGNDTNIDNAILMLFSVMQAKSVSEVVGQVKAQRSNTPVEDLIYPGMPISVYGTVRRKDDLLPKEIRLHDGRRSAQVVLSQEHDLDQVVRFLKRRPLNVLGIIQNIEKILTIKAGAMLLEQIHE